MGNRGLISSVPKQPRRILYVAYPLLPVSNESCGGAEQMLAVLESEIASRGHMTTIAACEGSRASGTVFPTGPETSELDRFAERDAQHHSHILELLRLSNGSDRQFDLVHDKSGSFWCRAGECDVPMLATLHLPRHFYPADAFRNVPSNLIFNCVSQAQRRTFSDVPNVVGVVQNGIPINRFPFVASKENYLLWMGRICEEKGAHLAIEIARRTGLDLMLAGRVYPFSYHELYYQKKVRPHLGTRRPAVCFVETPTFETKLRLLSNARALLIPSLVDETSSLVAMEAMACGTPVIAFRRGGIPEVISDRKTGFIVDTVDEMEAAVWQAEAIDPYACRIHVEDNFSASRMADEYEDLYERVLSLGEERELPCEA